MDKIKIIGEIGINHNGDIRIVRELIHHAKNLGFDYIKFQKRNPDVCVPKDQKDMIKSTPWGDMKYIDYKNKIEFSYDDYVKINNICNEYNIEWFCSVWDKDSIDFVSNLNDLKSYANIIKIPSALANNYDLINYAKSTKQKIFVSTGMCTQEMVEKIVDLSPNVIFHTNSTYPTPIDEIFMGYISELKKMTNIDIGYSGHEKGLLPTILSVALGVKWIERHITLDKGMWGSDQNSSLNLTEMKEMVQSIREAEIVLKNFKNGDRIITDSEMLKLKSLRGI